MRTSKTSPAWSANSTLSGTTTAARPPGLRMVRTCWRKLSCLLLVWTTKSSRSGAWLAPLVPNGGLVRTTSKRSRRRRLVDRVAERDVRLDLVQVEVHQREPARPRRRAPGRSRSACGCAWRSSRSNAPPRSGPSATRRRRRGSRRCRRPGRRSRSPCCTRGSGLMQRTMRLDEEARREVLAGALLALAGGLLEQTFERGGLDVDVERGPLGLVDQADELA